jgi:hypothetical protein
MGGARQARHKHRQELKALCGCCASLCYPLLLLGLVKLQLQLQLQLNLLLLLPLAATAAVHGQKLCQRL